MNDKYSREELTDVQSGEFPKRGKFCEKCKTWVPQFKELDDHTESRLLDLIDSQRSIEAVRELEAAIGCNRRWSKIWVAHSGKPTKVDLGPPCPYCGGTLRTNLAKQCQHCFKSWHD